MRYVPSQKHIANESGGLREAFKLAESVTQLSDLITMSFDHGMGPIREYPEPAREVRGADFAIFGVESLVHYANHVRTKNPGEFYAGNDHMAQAMHVAKAEPLEYQLNHFNNGQLAGGNMLPNGMHNFTGGPMTASPGMLSLNGGPHPMQGMGVPPPGMMPPPPTTPQIDAHTPGGPGVTPRLNHMQNPMSQSPGLRPGSSSGPPGSSGQQGTPSMGFNVPPGSGGLSAQKRKATGEGGPDGIGGGDGQGPPTRRQRTTGSVSAGNNPGFGPGPADGSTGDSPEGMSTRNRGGRTGKSPVQSKAQPPGPPGRNNKVRRGTGAV